MQILLLVCTLKHTGKHSLIYIKFLCEVNVCYLRQKKAGLVSICAGYHIWEFITTENQDLFTDIVACGLGEDLQRLKIIYSKAIDGH